MNTKTRQFLIEGKKEIGRQSPLINQELKYQLLKKLFDNPTQSVLKYNGKGGEK